MYTTQCMFDEADRLLLSLDKLSRIEVAINKYGWTPSLESLYGDELRAYSIEATVREVAHAVGKGIAAFARNLLNIIYRVISLIKKVFSKSRKSARKDINAIAPKLEAMQNKALTSRCATCADMIKHMNMLDKHLHVDYQQDMEFEAAEDIKAVRTAYLNKYNSLFSEEAAVGQDYRLKTRIPTKENKPIKTYGFTSKDALIEVDNTINTTFSAVQSRLKEVETAGKDVAKIVRQVRANSFDTNGGKTTATQGAYVYVRILFNDIQEIRRIDSMFKNAIVAMKLLSEKYVTKEEPEESNDVEPEETTNQEQSEQKQQPEKEQKK